MTTADKVLDYLAGVMSATTAEAAHMTGSKPMVVYNALRRMHRARCVHILGWDATPYGVTARYALGPGKDAPKPSRLQAKAAELMRGKA